MTVPAATTRELSADIVILGGGIAGLWVLNHLRSLGYSVLLLEAASLGSGQSIASQGIIHGGLKYALGGSLSPAAKAIADMPARWRASLAGRDRVDLSGCRVLSEHYYMWSEGSYRSRLKTFLGSKSLRGRIDAVEPGAYPHAMQQAKGQGSLYKLPDFVVDTGSLLHTLHRRHQDCIFQAAPMELQLPAAASGDQCRLTVTGAEGELAIITRRIILSAGEGNRSLLEQAGVMEPQMQTRPLNMVMLRKRSLPALYVHCIGDSFSLSPQLTVTSHPCEDGDMAWYLGGELAETGVARDNQQQIAAARQLLQRLFPWVNTDQAAWSCLRVNRAEGRADGSHRPDTAFLRAVGPYLVAWPTKLTLSPALADQVAAELDNQKIQPVYSFDADLASKSLRPVTVARPPWETGFA